MHSVLIYVSYAQDQILVRKILQPLWVTQNLETEYVQQRCFFVWANNFKSKRVCVCARARLNLSCALSFPFVA